MVVTMEDTLLLTGLDRIVEQLQHVVRVLDRIEAQGEPVHEEIVETLARMDAHAARTNELLAAISRTM